MHCQQTAYTLDYLFSQLDVIKYLDNDLLMYGLLIFAIILIILLSHIRAFFRNRILRWSAIKDMEECPRIEQQTWRTFPLTTTEDSPEEILPKNIKTVVIRIIRIPYNIVYDSALKSSSRAAALDNDKTQYFETEWRQKSVRWVKTEKAAHESTCWKDDFWGQTQCVRVAIAVATWLSVCLSRWCIAPERLSQSSCDLHQIVAQPF